MENYNIDLAPFVSIWLKPRETIAELVQREPKYMVNFFIITWPVLLAVEIGLALSTDLYRFMALFFLGIFVGIIAFFVVLYLWSGLLTFIGQRMGGYGAFEDVLTVVAWSYVPLLLFELIGITVMIVTTLFPGIVKVYNNIIQWIILILLLIWNRIIEITGLSEVHEISFGKSFLCVFISSTIVSISIFLISLLFFK